MRLLWKLTLGFMLVGLIGVAILAAFASFATRKEFDRFVFNEYQSSLTEALQSYYEENQGWDGLQKAFPFPGHYWLDRKPPTPRGDGLLLTNVDGVSLIRGMGYEPGENIPSEVLEDATPLEVDGQTVGWLKATRIDFRPSPTETLFVNRINRALICSAIGAALVSLIVGILLARTLTRPIQELTAATQAVAAGDLEQQVQVRSRDELGELATSFNSMSADLARSQTLRRQMTVDIAHELRTPISVILSHVDAIDDGVLPASEETFDVIRGEAQRLERLVEDLRTLSRADAGELTMIRRKVSLQSILNQALSAHRPLARERNIELIADLEQNLPQIFIDPDRINQVLSNLLTNALRHTEPGGSIQLKAEKQEGIVELRIRDSGPGIPPDELQRVFDRFYRIDKSRQRETGGSGLGLAIAKSIIENHGGTIHAESSPGQGATFVILLPIESKH